MPPNLPIVVEEFQIIDRVSVMHVGGLVTHLDFGHKAGQEALYPQDIFLLLGFDQVLAPGVQCDRQRLRGQLDLCGFPRFGFLQGDIQPHSFPFALPRRYGCQ